MIEKIPFTSREEWLAVRAEANDVTASVAGALLGVHPYTTALKLYNLKAGLTTKDDEDTPKFRRGRKFEPVAVDIMQEEKPGWRFEYPVSFYYHDPVHRIGATPDVICYDENGRRGIIQVKTVNFFGSAPWFVTGELEAPEWIAVQAIIEAMLVGAEFVCVAPFFYTKDDLPCPIVDVPLHHELYENRIKREVAEFWQRIAEKRPYPADYARDGDEIARMYPKDHGQEVDLMGDNELPEAVDRLIAARAAKKAAEDEIEIARNEIIFKMKDAAIARIADGRRISAKTSETNTPCKFALGKFCRQSTSRTVRLMK